MEIKRTKRHSTTLAGLFTRYTVLFCVNVLLIVLLLGTAFAGALWSGFLLPANYAELWLSYYEEEYRTAGTITEEMIPPGCTYGVFTKEGDMQYGTYSSEEAGKVWAAYENGDTGAGKGRYYRTLRRDDGSVCIVRYPVTMRFRGEKLNERIPDAERFMTLLAIGIFVLLLGANGFWVSRRFSGVLQKRLRLLNEATAQIAASDLEFETERSDIREIDEVMVSLDKMKQALRSSLQEQWLLESRKREEMAAIAHDIKTPLTVIRGNAELLAEEFTDGEEKECAEHILRNARQITCYLEDFRQILSGAGQQEVRERITAAEFKKELCGKAGELAAAAKCPAAFETEEELTGSIVCSRELLLRAWGNLLANAVEHTDPEKGIVIKLEERRYTEEERTVPENGQERSEPPVRRERANRKYWIAFVCDYGSGFSARDLLYADRKFYSGDESRHDRSHQGLGLSIVKQFATDLGGSLEYGNREERGTVEGAVVRMVLPAEEEE